MSNAEREKLSLEQLAYRFWQERGRPHGSPEEDWFRALRERSLQPGSSCGACKRSCRAREGASVRCAAARRSAGDEAGPRRAAAGLFPTQAS